MFKTGQVVEIKDRGNHYSQQTIRLDDGTYSLFFSDLRGYNKSLKVNDRVKVFYKNSITAGTISCRVTKCKKK